jgi:hypothetical protein
LALYTVFERYVVEYAQKMTEPIQTVGPEDFGQRLHLRVGDGIKRWNLEDFLNLFKTIIDATQEIREVKRYRDWVAHRNPRRQPSAQTDPASAYRVLYSTVEAIERA